MCCRCVHARAVVCAVRSRGNTAQRKRQGSTESSVRKRSKSYSVSESIEDMPVDPNEPTYVAPAAATTAAGVGVGACTRATRHWL